jgi:hypothetical protein
VWSGGRAPALGKAASVPKGERGGSLSRAASNGRLALLVGGGPAPGINGVISAAIIEACDQGIEVLGVQEGFR